MPRACSTDLRMRVIAAMQAGATCRAVAASLDIAPSTAGKWNRAFSRSGSRQLRATARSYILHRHRCREQPATASLNP